MAAVRQVARDFLIHIGLANFGKESLQCLFKADAGKVAWWRREGRVSIARTVAYRASR